MTKLELDEEKRKYKWGRYGIGKYVYRTEQQEDIKSHLQEYMHKFFPHAKLEYFT